MHADSATEPRDRCGSTRFGADAHVSPHRSSRTCERASGVRSSPWCVRAYSTGQLHKAHVKRMVIVSSIVVCWHHVGASSSSRSAPYLSVLKAARQLVTCCASTSTSGITVRALAQSNCTPYDLGSVDGAVEPGSVRIGMHPLRRTLGTMQLSNVARRCAGDAQQAGSDSLCGNGSPRMATPEAAIVWVCRARRVLLCGGLRLQRAGDARGASARACVLSVCAVRSWREA
jgi:hypothetical protein